MSDLTNALVRIGKRLVITFYVAHWMACLFFAIGERQTTLYCRSWLTLIGIQDSSFGDKYVNALYWSLTTMATVGYGDIKGDSTPERICNIVVMLIGAGLYAYNINEVGHIVGRYNMLAEQYKYSYNLNFCA